MSRSLSTFVLLLLLLGVGLSGCVEDRTSLTIRKMLVPDSTCTATAGSAEFISMGTLDISQVDNPDVTVQYFLFPEVENNLVSTEEGEGVELNQLEIIEARVSLDFGALVSTLDADAAKFRYPAFLTMAPGDSAVIQVLGIPAPTARVLASLLPNVGDTVIVRIKVKFLYQLGEYEHESMEVEFPVQVCNHCLLTPLSQAPLCDSGLLPDTIREGNGCNIFQDVPVDCCQSGGKLICPAVDTSEDTTQ